MHTGSFVYKKFSLKRMYMAKFENDSGLQVGLKYIVPFKQDDIYCISLTLKPDGSILVFGESRRSAFSERKEYTKKLHQEFDDKTIHFIWRDTDGNIIYDTELPPCADNAEDEE